MKNILLFSLLLITIVVNGQKFDFYNKKLTDHENGVICNSNFTFTLINFNSFKYSVLVNNKPVNYNLDMLDLFKTYLQKLDNKSEFDTTRFPPERTMKINTYKDLYDSYIKLKTSEQFYYSLFDLVSSDLSTIDIIDYKKEYYKQFIDNIKQEDNSAVPVIIKYYSVIISNILLNGPMIKPADTIGHKKAIDSILKDTKEIVSSEIPQKLASLYCAINDQTFTINSFIPKPNADDLIITIIAKPKSPFNKSTDEIKIDIPFLIKGGWKIDFSTGIFLSNIVNQEYVNKPSYEDDTVSGYYLVREDKHPFSYGIAGYMHAYWRNACNFNGAIALGLGIDQNTQVKIMPGLSIILGRKERFIFNGGLVIGKSKQLSSVQDESHLYKDKTDPIFFEQYKIGWFCGVSYNLAK